MLPSKRSRKSHDESIDQVLLRTGLILTTVLNFCTIHTIFRNFIFINKTIYSNLSLRQEINGYFNCRFGLKEILEKKLVPIPKKSKKNSINNCFLVRWYYKQMYRDWSHTTNETTMQMIYKKKKSNKFLLLFSQII